MNGVHAIPGRRAVAEAVRAGRPLHEIVVDESRPDEQLAEAASTADVRVITAPRRRLDELAGGVAHQGVVAVAPPFAYTHLGDVAGDLLVVLDGVNDPQNLGAIARSAEAAGAAAVVIPKRRTASVTPAVERAAAGALSWLPVVRVPNLARALGDLADLGVWSVGLDGGAPRSVWDEPLLDGPVAIVAGAEGRGLSRLVRERCDAVTAIPLAGRVDSLNVSVAAAVALFEAARRRRGGGALPDEGNTNGGTR